MKKIFSITIVLIVAGLAVLINSCKTSRMSKTASLYDTLYTSQDKPGLSLEMVFEKGKAHNYPLMAVWITDTSYKYLQTLYVAESIAKGVFRHGETSTGKWLPGERRRPAALPVWAHSRGVKEEDGWYVPTVKTPIADAYTGATPLGNFVLNSRLKDDIPPVFDIYFEINQTWDWNDFWTNDKYPDDEEYKTSCQPSLVYRARINTAEKLAQYELKLIGHGHYSGKDGNIYPDLGTFTTALEITKWVYVTVKQE
ncbi:MAG: hypothetical protein JXB00_12030 [Bacteroidales bacterium]|nr:hypothetical protein [Bacteroidales bacterium]